MMGGLLGNDGENGKRNRRGRWVEVDFDKCREGGGKGGFLFLTELKPDSGGSSSLGNRNRPAEGAGNIRGSRGAELAEPGELTMEGEGGSGKWEDDPGVG
jgi:hypothetical protein